MTNAGYSGWVLNSNLTQLSPEKAENAITDKMRKDLKEAYILAAESNPVEHYKEILQRFEEELVAQEEARIAAAATPKKSKKGKTKAADEDLEMADADDAPVEKPKSSKKRKAEDDIGVSLRSLFDFLRKMLIILYADPSTTRFCQEAQDQTQHLIYAQGSKWHIHSQDQGRAGSQVQAQIQEGQGDCREEGRGTQGAKADS